MRRLVEPSEAYHALLDWQTGFEIQIPISVTQVAATNGLTELLASFPRLSGRLVRTAEGFAFEDAEDASVAGSTVEATRQGARVLAPLSAFAFDISRPNVTTVSGRLHHALGDVTSVLSIVDHLIGLVGIEPNADSICLKTALDWPVPAERVFGEQQATEALRETRLFFSEITSPPLNPAHPITVTLEPPLVRAIDEVCDVANTSLTAVIAAVTARSFCPGLDRVTVGVPVDCRVFIDPSRLCEIPARTIGNCSHGALVSVTPLANTLTEVLSAASHCHTDLMTQLESEAPTAPFFDGRLYQPDNNAPPPQFVVSNARGAARRFSRLDAAGKVIVLPRNTIPAMPMIAVNESPAAGVVDIAYIVDPIDFATQDVCSAASALRQTLTELGNAL